MDQIKAPASYATCASQGVYMHWTMHTGVVDPNKGLRGASSYCLNQNINDFFE